MTTHDFAAELSRCTEQLERARWDIGETERRGDARAIELGIEIERLTAELAALAPWAEIGKRVVNERWYIEDGVYGCCYGPRQKGHDPDCPIPALLAQLEAEQ